MPMLQREGYKEAKFFPLFCLFIIFVFVSWWGGIEGKITVHHGSQLMIFMVDGQLGPGHMH